MNNLPRIGIDIGTTSIKMVELAPGGHDKWKLMSAATMPSVAGGILANQANLGAFSQAIIKMRKEAGIKSQRVIAALPEEQVSSHVVELPLMGDEEVKQALQWQVEQYIPIPADRAVWSYQVIRKDQAKGGMEVLLVAAAKNLVNAYISVLEQAGLEVVAMETELMATARSEVPAESPISLVVDIGSKSTDVGVVQGGQLVFARTVATAGEAFTRAIQSSLGLDANQAEQYKNTYGFSADKLNGKLAEAMKPVLNVIAGEIKKTADFYTSKHSNEGLHLVTVSGGVSVLPEMVTVLTGMLGMEVSIGNPFMKLLMDKGQTQALAGSGPIYGVAIGLAMREI
jgi:type IV pilus assembly protein PilM